MVRSIGDRWKEAIISGQVEDAEQKHITAGFAQIGRARPHRAQESGPEDEVRQASEENRPRRLQNATQVHGTDDSGHPVRPTREFHCVEVLF